MKAKWITIGTSGLFVLGVLVGVIVSTLVRKPCPKASPPDPIEQARFDSLSTALADRDTTIKYLELQVTQPIIYEKFNDAMEFVGSASLSSKLDTLLATPF